MYFTPEQLDAIKIHSHNLIVTAGAGSGKTRVLVERYLDLLEQHPDWQLTELVAITFTEKAAREMRDRVRLTMRERVQAASSEAEQARWRELESQLDQARIGTIHSLCAQILRSNPAQVPVDPGFAVADENEAYLLKVDAVEQALAELVGQPTGELLQLYGVGAVRRVLLDFAERSTAQTFTHSLPDSSQALLALWGSQREEALTAWQQTLQNDNALWELLHWQPAQGWASSDDKIMAGWSTVHDYLASIRADNPNQAVQALNAYGVINLQGGSGGNWGGKEILADAKAALKNIRETARAYLESLPLPLTEADQEAARRLFLWRDAVQGAAVTYTTFKTERAVLDFDDLEALTVELLNTYPDVVARYAGAAFKHVMVDEFQDTNQRQRDLIYRLCGFEGGNAPGGRLFVVGDPKQSIYAFRGADVGVFNEVSSAIVEWGGLKVPLSRSFRTQARLVEAFNRLFKLLLKPKTNARYEVQFDADMSAERAAEAFHTQSVDLILFEKPDKTWTSEDLRTWEAYEIGQRIKDWVQAGTPIFDKRQGVYRPIQYGDVAILMRALTHAPIYEEVFKALQLPYITIAGRGYYNRQEVWDMLNLLKVLHNPADNLALASVLRSPLFGLSDDGLFALRLAADDNNNRLPLWEALQRETLPYPLPDVDHAPLEFARQVLTRLHSLAGRVTVEALLEMALDETAYDAILTALPDGNRRRGNVEKLLDMARRSGRVSLSEFMVYIRDLTSIEPREGEAAVENAGAVQIMSVHKSKGLEFPLVILANADWTRQDRNSSALLFDPDAGATCLIRDADNNKVETFAAQQVALAAAKRDLAEHKRLFYVAATRAQDYLWVAGKIEAEAKFKADSWLGMLAEVLEADEGLQHEYIRFSAPAEPPDLNSLITKTETTAPGWQVLEKQLDHVNPRIPPLVQEVPFTPPQSVRHLSVSQLEQLGSIPYYRPEDRGKRMFRQSVLHDAPLPLRPIQQDDRDPYRTLRRAVGNMVHRALQVQALPNRHSPSDLHAILQAYAWDLGITQETLTEEAVREAESLLYQFQRRGEPDSLRQADRVLREVPFIYRVRGRIIHGVIDVLYRSQDSWYVLDYKTADIKPQFVVWHAQRYAVQLGAYAQAVQERTGSDYPPRVQLYYLHPGELVEISEDFWRSALAQFDGLINVALQN